MYYGKLTFFSTKIWRKLSIFEACCSLPLHDTDLAFMLLIADTPLYKMEQKSLDHANIYMAMRVVTKCSAAVMHGRRKDM